MSASLKVDQIKVFLRMLAVGVQAVVMTVFMAFFWLNCYDVLVNPHFGILANFSLFFIYFFILIFTIYTYGGTKYAYYQRLMLMLSQGLAAVLSNLFLFIIFIFILRAFPPVWPIVALTLIDFIVILVFTMMTMPLFARVFPPKQILAVCNPDSSEEFLEKFAAREDLFKIKKTLPAGTPVNEIIETFREQKCTAIVCGVDENVGHADLVKRCYAENIRLYLVPQIYEILLQGAAKIHLTDTPVVLMRNDGIPYDRRFVKRLMDLAICIPVLILVSPILLFTALWIKLEDGGNVFFRQERITRGGKHFNVIKFRSMRMDAEKNGAQPCVPGDARVTRVGKIIRASRIDELPQIFNVLAGDMTIVGPRPERYEHVAKYTAELPEFAYRLTVKAGITGYAQIYGKYNTSPLDKLKLDLMYIRNQSFINDLKIIVLTMRTMLTPSAAEGFSQKRSEEINAAGTPEAAGTPDKN